MNSKITMKILRSLLGLCALLTTAAANQAAVDELLGKDHVFATSIYKNVAQFHPGNLVQSHLSQFTPLVLLSLASRGETVQELNNYLNLPQNTVTKEAFKSLLPQLQNNNGYRLNFSSQCYVQPGFEVTEEFKNLATNVFSTSVINEKFQADKWSPKTGGNARTIVSLSKVDGSNKVVLVNNLAFSAEFVQSFPLDATYDQEFYMKAESGVPIFIKTPTMHHTGEYNYFESAELGAKLLQLELKGGEASLVLVLPNNTDSLGELETKVHLLAQPPAFTREKVYVSLPKFAVKSNVDVVNGLLRLGLHKFLNNQGKADVSGVGGNPGELYVKEFLQDGLFEVNELGIGAENATSTAITAPAALGVDPNEKKFIADHPFLFFVQANNVLLFAGRIASLFTH